MSDHSNWAQRLEESQEINHWHADGNPIFRIPYGEETGPLAEMGESCPVCSAAKGQYHVIGCHAEACGCCGNQAICFCQVNHEPIFERNVSHLQREA